MPKCTTFSSTGCTTGCATKIMHNHEVIVWKIELLWLQYTQGETYLSTDRSLCGIKLSPFDNQQTNIIRKIKVVKSKGNGGDQYLILSLSLRRMHRLRTGQNISHKQQKSPMEQIEIAMQRYAAEPEYNRKESRQIRSIDEALWGAKRQGNREGSWGMECSKTWIKNWRIVKHQRMQSGICQNGMDALVAKYGKPEIRIGQSTLSDKLAYRHTRCFVPYTWGERPQFLLDGYVWLCKDIMGCYPSRWRYRFDEIFPSSETFLRSPRTAEGWKAIYLARYGDHAWNQKYGNFINRDYSAVKAGECWVSDHRQLDQIWRMPDGKLVRPWFTCWICFKTQKVLSWSLHADAPRADHVIDTFVSGVERWGVPSSIYIDNGKDYRCLDFAGGRRMIKVVVDERKTRSFADYTWSYHALCYPYNAQTKPIERLFWYSRVAW